MLKSKNISIIDWLPRLFNRCTEFGVVSENRPDIQKENDKKKKMQIIEE